MRKNVAVNVQTEKSGTHKLNSVNALMEKFGMEVKNIAYVLRIPVVREVVEHGMKKSVGVIVRQERNEMSLCHGGMMAMTLVGIGGKIVFRSPRRWHLSPYRWIVRHVLKHMVYKCVNVHFFCV